METGWRLVIGDIITQFLIEVIAARLAGGAA
jgi:hypothetical protein